ncbi:hypothetical protein [Prosthecobacter vanneervenii]|uniref:BioF2-like acetyltransferase domain-containing protein n=1 Tax=Prosthecobacter vanneervenii TaxID=48466 RepID=A0A7W8DII9_9BACT|nr:hypothetical protein [Prosthecobacter vanneervenii]MBB5030816.1 hypothetical protein [Prosthecobacter vanneervenii]
MTPAPPSASAPAAPLLPASGRVIALLRKLQIWCMRLLLPFLQWRVPVRLLRGAERVTGREVRLRVAAVGPDAAAHLIQRFFAVEPVEESCTLVPVWSLDRHLRTSQPEGDLTLISVNNLSARLFLNQADALAVPPMISSYIHLPKDVATLLRGNRKLADDFRRVRQQGFASHISVGDVLEYDDFYSRFYRPYVITRHNELVQVAPRSMLRLVHRVGGIQWLTQRGERMGGGLVYRSGGDFHAIVNGLRQDKADELLRHGALAAMYVFMLQQALEMGCTRVMLGGSRPSLHDGVLRYKSKWLTGLTRHDGYLSANHTLLLRWPRLSSPVADFLSHTSLIHHEPGGGYSALWAFPPDLPLTAENLQQQYRALRLRGLHRMRILLSAPPPADFVCPPEVRLIDLRAVPQSPDLLLKLHP